MTTKTDTRQDRPETYEEADIRRTREASAHEFGEGEKSFHDGEPSDACPYASNEGSSTRRYLWMQGFLGARLIAKGLL